mmetsp:Transcript_36137/g.52944  ORF Transcript_36137/g.52944 Transcript_36137/m.52944 type:complete len:383 (-) Transcript_36137:544-1692(-)
MHSAFTVYTRSQMAELNSDDFARVPPGGPKYDPTRSSEWLEDYELHLRSTGFNRLSIGEDGPASDTPAGLRAFARRKDMFCGQLLKALGSSASVVVPKDVDRYDPVALWAAVSAHITGSASSGTSTVHSLHGMFTTKYDADVSPVHVHLAMLLTMRDRIVRNDPDFAFPEKLTIAALLVSIPRGGIFESVITALLLELAKPRTTVDAAFVVAQLEQCERDHRDSEGANPSATALFARNPGATALFAARGRNGRPPRKYPSICSYCKDPHHEVVQCDKLFRRMLIARGLVQARNETQQALIAAERSAVAAETRGVAIEQGYGFSDDDEYDPPAPARSEVNPGAARKETALVALPAPAPSACQNWFDTHTANSDGFFHPVYYDG